MNELQPWFFIFLMLAAGFWCGYGWGKHTSEVEIRKERASMEANKVYVSVPMDEKLAPEVLRLLSEFIERVQKEMNHDN